MFLILADLRAIEHTYINYVLSEKFYSIHYVYYIFWVKFSLNRITFWNVNLDSQILQQLYCYILCWTQTSGIVHDKMLYSLLLYCLIIYIFHFLVPPKSAIWKSFVKTATGGRCKICQLDVKTAGNTTNLHFYLRRAHPDIVQMQSNTSVKRKKMVIILN